MVAAVSICARPGMGISMPVAWEEVRSLKSAYERVSGSYDRQSPGSDVWGDAGRVTGPYGKSSPRCCAHSTDNGSGSLLRMRNAGFDRPVY
ncbi:hypothetical protein [Burkholderia cepacia]|uniref:hypothetical protein n=1 Tax=Burkholderia cepacia TaxID=292 RepID=UPI003C7D6C85